MSEVKFIEVSDPKADSLESLDTIETMKIIAQIYSDSPYESDRALADKVKEFLDKRQEIVAIENEHMTLEKQYEAEQLSFTEKHNELEAQFQKARAEIHEIGDQLHQMLLDRKEEDE